MHTRTPTLPERVVAAYARQAPSISRLILEAQWAHLQYRTALEHTPDAPANIDLERAAILHVGALADVLSLRSPHDGALADSARGHGTALRYLDARPLTEYPRSGLGYLRLRYAHLHGHGDTPRPLVSDADLQAPDDRINAVIYPSGADLIADMNEAYFWTRVRHPDFVHINRKEEHRRALICRGLILDLASVLAPTDRLAATRAAAIGHEVRTLDHRPAVSDATARAYLLDAYRDLPHDDGRYDQNCPDSCSCEAAIREHPERENCRG